MRDDITKVAAELGWREAYKELVSVKWSQEYSGPKVLITNHGKEATIKDSDSWVPTQVNRVITKGK